MGLKPEIHSFGEAPDVVFTTRVQALSALARQILAAKARGDTLTAAKLLAQFRAQLGRDDLPTLVAQAKAADMPSDFMLNLANLSDELAGIGKWIPVLLGLAAVAWFISRGRRGGS